jgi:excisionase family DNA binding protein
VHHQATESFLTPSEVLLRLRVNVKTLYRLIGDGGLPAVRVGRQWRVRPKDLETWLQHQRNGATLGLEHAGGTLGGAPESKQRATPKMEGVLQQEV